MKGKLIENGLAPITLVCIVTRGCIGPIWTGRVLDKGPLHYSAVTRVAGN